MSMHVRWVLLLAVVALVTTLTVPALGRSSEVTRGDLATFAAGLGTYEITGHAQMVRRANGTTKVQLQIKGLDPTKQYTSHVHKQACDDGEADGHFQQAPGGGDTPPNEIWPGGGAFSPNAAGVANVKATADYSAGPDAVSVVVHVLEGSPAPKIACADLS